MMNEYFAENGRAQVLRTAGFIEILMAVLAKGTPFRFQAKGFSMSPFIRDGDVLTLAPAPGRLRCGDVAAFINPCNNRLCVHRVVQISPSSYQMRGDNAPEPDGTIPHGDILARLIRVERGGHSARFGLGIERLIIAFLSRNGRLVPFLYSLSTTKNLLFKRPMP